MKNVLKVLLVLFIVAVIILPLAVFGLFRYAASQAQTHVVPVMRTVSYYASDVVRVSDAVSISVSDPASYVSFDMGEILQDFDLQQVTSGDRLVLGGTYTLLAGETLEGSLFVVGGLATLEPGSTVYGDAVMLGGTLQVDGRIEGDMIVIGGLVALGETAVVEGDVSTLGGELERAAGSRIEGSVNNGVVSGPLPFSVPGKVYSPNFDVNFNPFWDGLWFLFRSFMWAALAVLVALFAPNHSERVAKVILSQPVVAGGLGLLTSVVAPLLLVAIAITILGIPITLVGLFLLVVAWAFGVVVIGMEVGKRLEGIMNQEWAPAVSAGAGTFLVTVVANGIGVLIPCVGWMVPAFVGILGLGAVMLTRFGTQDYPQVENPYQHVSGDQPVDELEPSVPSAEVIDLDPEDGDSES